LEGEKETHGAEVPLLAIAPAITGAGFDVAPAMLVRDVTDGVRWVAGLEDGPLWIKSVGQGHPRFCMNLDHRADLPLGIRQARKRSTFPGVLVERALHGEVYRIHLHRHRTDAQPVILRADLSGESHYRVVELLVLDTHLDHVVRDALVRLTRACAEALEDDRPWLELEVVVDPRRYALTDVWLSHEPTVMARALHDAGLDAFLHGETPEPALAVAWLTSRSGVIRAIEGLDAALASDGVIYVSIAARVGETVGHVIDKASRDRLGYVLARAESAREAEAVARAARAMIRIRTEIALP